MARALPLLAAATVLQVVLFGFDGKLQPVMGRDVGELRLVGAAIVERQPGENLGQPACTCPSTHR
jgi:hypothetical protein